jgi:hypothetical protein
MKTLLKGAAAAIKAMLAFFAPDRGAALAELILVLAPKVLPIVKSIADLTPTRADDELIVLFKSYALPGVEKYLALPMEFRGAALQHAAVETLRLFAPNGTSDRLLRAAVELAYLSFTEIKP